MKLALLPLIFKLPIPLSIFQFGLTTTVLPCLSWPTAVRVTVEFSDTVFSDTLIERESRTPVLVLLAQLTNNRVKDKDINTEIRILFFLGKIIILPYKRSYILLYFSTSRK